MHSPFTDVRTNGELLKALADQPTDRRWLQPVMLVDGFRYPAVVCRNLDRIFAPVTCDQLKAPLRQAFGPWANTLLTDAVWAWLEDTFAKHCDFLDVCPPVTTPAEAQPHATELPPEVPLRVWHSLKATFVPTVFYVAPESATESIIKVELPQSVIDDVIEHVRQRFRHCVLGI
jgi:hypothetical protein